MTEKKPWYQRIADRFRKPMEKETIEYKLSDQGIKIAKDTRLQDRLNSLYELQTEIMKPIENEEASQYLAELKGRLDALNMTIMLTASPYARAGDYPQYRRMLRGWSRWYAIASSWIQRTEDYFIKAESNPLDYGVMDTDIFVRMLQDVLQKHVFADGFTVLNVCFRDRDVSERGVAVIHSIMPQKGQTPWGFEEGLKPQS